jgi:hypothetical protein
VTRICGVLWLLHLLVFSPSADTAERVTPSLHKATRTAVAAFVPQEVQETGQGGYSLKISVELVTVDAIVRDRQGAIVDGLRAEDFAV